MVTNYVLFQMTKRELRKNPGATDEEIRQAIGAHPFDMDIIREARKDFLATRDDGQLHD